jgi:hypothetical protein
VDTVIVTEKLLLAGRTGPGGWNRLQIECLGIKWPPKKGWKSRIRGRSIPRDKAERFVALRGATSLSTSAIDEIADTVLDILVVGKCEHGRLPLIKRLCNECIREAVCRAIIGEDLYYSSQEASK